MKRILVNSLPKSGTHLANKLFESFGYQFSGIGFSSSSIYGRYSMIKSILRGGMLANPCVEVGLDIAACLRIDWVEKSLHRMSTNEYCGGHLPYSDCMYDLLKGAEVSVIHMNRDPRDVLLSWVHYVPKMRWHYGYQGLENLTLEQKVRKVLYGYQSGRFNIESFLNILSRSNEWMKKNDILTIRFESLVGTNGGGNIEEQIQCIESIGSFAGLVNFDAEEKSEMLFGGTKVFRKGKIGSYKDELSTVLIDEINMVLEKKIVCMGYEV